MAVGGFGANGAGTATISGTGLLTGGSLGTVTVTASANDGSGISGSTIITVTNTIGITNVDDQQNTTVYPNPSNGRFTIEVQSTGVQDIDVVITNVVGQQVLLEKLTQINGTYQKEIDLKGYSPGVYTLQLRTDDGEVNKRIVIE